MTRSLKVCALCSSLCSFSLIIALTCLASSAAAQTRSAIFVMDADGTNVVKASHTDDMWLGSAAWSHDGKKLLYGGLPVGDFTRIRIYLQVIGEDQATDLGTGDAPCWSPDDSQIAFCQSATNAFGARPGVWVMNFDGRGREWISEGRRPRWSPDGEKLAFVSDHEGFESVYVMELTTEELTRIRVLERGYDQIIGASWSPDSQRLVFVGYKGGRHPQSQQAELAIVDAKENQKAKVLHAGYVGWHPDWSPDGKQILFWIRDGVNERLHLLDVDSDKPPRVLPGQFTPRNSDPVWSPDGKQIAFASDR